MKYNYEDDFLKGNCLLCGSDENHLVYRLTDQLYESDIFYSLLCCKVCHGLFIDGSVFESLDQYYSTAYPQKYFEGGIDAYGFIPRIKKHLVDNFINHKQKAKCLDIGCGGGTFLKYMKSKGHRVYGVEPDKKAAEIVRKKLHCILVSGRVEDIIIKEKFDLITLWDVLEHFVNPTYNLKKINTILNKDGKVIFGVPNFDSFESKLLGASWFGLEIPRHVIQCTPSILYKLFDEAGLKLKKIQKVRGSSYFTKSFLDKRLLKPKQILPATILKAIELLLVYTAGNSSYLVGVAEHR